MRSALLLLSRLLLGLLALAGGARAETETGAGMASGGGTVEITVFWEPGCPYCQRAKTFLADLDPATRDWMRVDEIDVTGSLEGQLLFEQANRLFGIDQPGVPLIVVGTRPFLGSVDDETTGQAVLDAADACRRASCPTLGELLARGEGAEPYAPDDMGAEEVPRQFRLPLIGTIDPGALSLPALTIVLAAIDGFNPCAMWVLVFLIGLLVGMQDRFRMWVLGGAFLLTSGLVYFGFLAAWLNLFLLLGALVWVRLAVGLFALGSGAYYLREFAANSAAECRVTDPMQRRRIMDAFRASVAEKRFLLSLGGVMVLAVAVNAIELFCSAGIPAVYTQVLAASGLASWQYYALLVLYVVVFMLDDAAIFALAMFTLAATGMTTRYLRVSHLAGGVIMLVLGVLLIFAPDWLAFAG